MSISIGTSGQPLTFIVWLLRNWEWAQWAVHGVEFLQPLMTNLFACVQRGSNKMTRLHHLNQNGYCGSLTVTNDSSQYGPPCRPIILPRQKSSSAPDDILSFFACPRQDPIKIPIDNGRKQDYTKWLPRSEELLHYLTTHVGNMGNSR